MGILYGETSWVARPVFQSVGVLHIPEYEQRIWGNRYDHPWPGVKRQHLAKFGFCLFLNHPLSHIAPPTHPPYAAICLKQVLSWYHVIEVGNLNCRYNISKDEFSQQPRILSSAQSGLRWKQQCRCEVRAEKGENTAKKSLSLRQKLKCNVELNHFWQHAFIPIPLTTRPLQFFQLFNISIKIDQFQISGCLSPTSRLQRDHSVV